MFFNTIFNTQSFCYIFDKILSMVFHKKHFLLSILFALLMVVIENGIGQNNHRSKESIIKDLEECRSEAFSDPYSVSLKLASLHVNIQNLQNFNLTSEYYNLRGLTEWAKGNHICAIEWFKKTLAINKNDSFTSNMAEAANNTGTLYRFIGEPDSARKYLQKSYDIDKARNNVSGLSKTLYELGILERNLGHYDLSYERFSQALLSQESQNDSLKLMHTLQSLGNLHFHLQNTNKANENYKRALQIAYSLNDSLQISIITTCLTATLLGETGSDSILNIVNKAKLVSKSINDYNSLLALYGNLAKAYLLENKIDSAFFYYEYALTFINKVSDPYLSNTFLNNLAEAFLKAGDYNNSYTYHFKSLISAKEINDMASIRDSYLGLAGIDSINKDYKSALRHYVLGVKARDSIFNTETNNRIAELEILYNREKDKKEIAKLKSQARYNHLLSIFGIIFSISIVAILIMIIQLYKKKRLIAEQKASILEKDKTQVQIALKANKKELTGKTISLAKSEEVIKQLNKELTKVMENAPDDISDKLKSILSTMQITKKQNSTVKEFEQRLKEINDDFICKLCQLFPNLSPTEIRLCALIRLQLSTKDIAIITNRSPRTIEYTRSNIRKKINLSPGENLTTKLIVINKNSNEC